MNRFPQTFFSLGKTINIIFMYLLAPLIVQDLKKKLSIRWKVISMHNFWVKMDHWPKQEHLLNKKYHIYDLPIALLYSITYQENRNSRYREN